MNKRLSGLFVGVTLFCLCAPIQAQNVNASGLQTRLQEQWCSQDWTAALATVDALLAIPTDRLGYHEQLQRQRQQIAGYAETGRMFDVMPGCEETALDFSGAAASIGSRPTPARSTQAAGVVSVLSVRLDGDGWIVGRVRNDTGHPIQFVELEYESTGALSRLLDSGTFFVDDESLEPGEVSGFRYPTRGYEESRHVRITDITWLD